MHDRTARPSISTVQLPQVPSLHPGFVPVNPNPSRSTSISRAPAAASTVRRVPLIVNVSFAMKFL
jgi:hypothetical protein